MYRGLFRDDPLLEGSYLVVTGGIQVCFLFPLLG